MTLWVFPISDRSGPFIPKRVSSEFKITMSGFLRAWNVRRGDTALEAAAAIHSDLARGFIRAECFTYDACLQYGSEKTIREKGLFRLEGRDYQVQDGDILNIRFNV